MFIDRIKIQVKSGKGGDGCISFRREKYVPRGGPDGGDGGQGGDVLLKASSKYPSLSHLYHISHFKAGNGQNGKGKNQHGKNGKNIIISVPQGTVAYTVESTQKLSLLGELIRQGESLVVANGGMGGIGNTSFKTSKNRAPRIRKVGEPGKSLSLLLELKLIADVGLVGYPNAGKTTLLSQISNAKPKIASYPFTTLTPNLGVAYIDDKKLTIADIPGIIDGAHKGKGLGLEFLRHIERTHLLIFVLDVTRDDPLSDYNALRNEIREYNPRILEKPSIVVLNKIDLVRNCKLLEESCRRLLRSGKGAISISALKGDGIDKLRAELMRV